MRPQLFRPFSKYRPLSSGLRSLSTNAPDGGATGEKTIPGSARVVIVGGGVVGCSVAYHLAKRGVTDVLLLEQAKLTAGTTWHACGLIGQLRGTNTETQMSGVYASKIFEELTRETEQETGFRRCGSITLARTSDRMSVLKRAMAKATAFGITAEIISPRKANEKFSNLIREEDLEGALWLPNDGTANASDVCMAFAKGAKNRGVKILEQVRVTGINVQTLDNGSKKVTGVVTDSGSVDAEVVINCGGMWARELGKLAGVPIPLHACEHFYAISEPLPGSPASPELPLMRDPDGCTYFREWSGGIAAGGFEPNAVPCFPNGPPPKFEFSLLDDNLDHFSILLEEAIHRVPVLEQLGFNVVNGPESFTVDSHYLVGETDVRKFYVAAGMNSSGIASAGGAGKALADWVVDDTAPFDLWPVDIRRFGDWSNNAHFLRERASETLGVHYAVRYPNQDFETGRGVRRSPLYEQLKQRGACFGSKAGWERAQFFAPRGEEAKVDLSFSRFPKHFELVRQEHVSCRTSVGLFDQSSFGKLLVTGADALSLMQRVCSNNIPADSGAVVYTAMLNDRGGIETDCTVSCLDPGSFMVVTSTAQANRDAHWIRHNILPGEHVSVVDMTSGFSVLSVMGPKARALLGRVCDTDLSNERFPFGTWQYIDVGYATVRAVRVTYVGELGWELHVPTEMASYVHEVLCEAGEELQMRHCGYMSIDSLRIEKGYRAWGHDIGADDTPLEAGLGFAVKLNKSVEFRGKPAILEQKTQGLRKRLVSFVAEDPNACILGDEPIYRNGVLSGFVRSASYGHTIGKPVCLGYISAEDELVNKKFINSGEYQVEVEGTRYAVHASLQAPYDPKSIRVKQDVTEDEA